MRKCKIINYPYPNLAHKLYAYLVSNKNKVRELDDLTITTSWDGDNQIVIVHYRYPSGFSTEERIPASPLNSQIVLDDVVDDILRTLLKERRESHA